MPCDQHYDCQRCAATMADAATLAALADRIEPLIAKLPTTPDPGHIGDWKEKARRFVDGLRRAAAANEDVDFH